MFGLLKKEKASERFVLESGERQTGKSIDDIRFDHRTRYEYICDFLTEKRTQSASFFGLDAFCATGYGSKMLCDKLNCHVWGVDASGEAVRFAEEHYSDEQVFYTCKKFPFSLPADTFDFICCIESLEHVAEDKLFLTSLSRSLKPAGYLFLSVPNETIHSLALNPNEFHQRHYTHGEISDLVTAVGGLRLVEWFGQNIYHMSEGRIHKVLPDSAMGLNRVREGQVLLFVFQGET